MDLILWRHAEAEVAAPDQDDMLRPLTAKGHKQAARMGEWLDAHCPSRCRVLCSPALRTVQTGEGLRRKFSTHPALAPDQPTQELLVATGWPSHREPILVIGHQPTLGRVMSLLITGQEQGWTLRKGAVCWIAQKAADWDEKNYIRLLLGPDLVN